MLKPVFESINEPDQTDLSQVEVHFRCRARCHLLIRDVTIQRCFKLGQVYLYNGTVPQYALPLHQCKELHDHYKT